MRPAGCNVMTHSLDKTAQWVPQLLGLSLEIWPLSWNYEIRALELLAQKAYHSGQSYSTMFEDARSILEFVDPLYCDRSL
jgi:hypothetical protein